MDSSDSPRESIPGYVLHEQIGRGGMGVVHRARDLRFDRDVAIKLLNEETPSQSAAAARFRIEAKISGQLQHPGIPAVHELGDLENGKPFLAMKLVRGLTLQALLEMRANPQEQLERFIGIFEQVCHAVGYAHAHRVIHRDLKPGNVMVGKFGEVQLMDWGLAKVVGEENPAVQPETTQEVASTIALFKSEIDTPHAGSSATKTGDVLGTISYMAPEQASGEIRSLDARSDVFGLGAILCQILIGSPPYVGRDFNELRIKAIRGDLRETMDLLDHAPVESELIYLCKRCLSLHRENRPADGQAVAKEIEQFRAETEARARQAELELKSAEIREAEGAKRRRLLLISGAIVAATLVLGTVFSLVGLFRAQAAAEKERIATKAAQDSEAKAINLAEKESLAKKLAGQMTSEAIAAYRKMIFEIQNQLKDYDEFPELRQSLLDKAESGLKKLERERPSELIDNRAFSWIHLQLGDIAIAAENTEKAEIEYRAGHELAQRHTDANPKNVIAQFGLYSGLSRLGEVRLKQGRAKEALEYFQQAAKVTAEMEALDSRNVDTLSALAGNALDLGDTYSRLEKAADAQKQFQTAIDVNRTLIEMDQTDYAGRANLLVALERLADMKLDARDFKAASELLEKKLELELNLQQERPRDRRIKEFLGITYDRLAKVAQENGQTHSARDYLLKYLLISQNLAEPAIIPSRQRDVASAYEQLGNFDQKQGDLTAAYESHLKSLEIREKLDKRATGNERAKNDLCINYNNLGLIKKAQREYGVAADWFSRAVAIIESLKKEGKVVALDPAILDWLPHHHAVCSKAPQAIADINFVFEQTSLEQVQELALIHLKDCLIRKQPAEALACTEKLIQWSDKLASEKQAEPYYAVACAYALCAAGESLDESLVAKAMEYLEKVKASGYFTKFPPAVDHLAEDEDLRPIRNHPKFVAFVDGVRRSTAAQQK